MVTLSVSSAVLQCAKTCVCACGMDIFSGMCIDMQIQKLVECVKTCVGMNMEVCIDM